ncbi:Aca1p KNAG_0L01300 [Huiozyma naganishii CBS 8797]|uniref:BZIP domain-containing protein n=1 Tax=Huiozyma naganishii (strain ATCC MYA-139 / BCRC 22969 / CBS 8797 / KCTC 17520 / NBRC 10181 / NCYC 3082 / Yp74L-3) TaxID=1071383 RepID=J7RCZ0_HUIN7|nr:hypothetical protein KNAG_0L01300 [Kazachstania naganishii CBS 8797]CCK72750.1 hypothetical protein KNAG_0L01300 [Kazachstania naganishii CBS 8797]
MCYAQGSDDNDESSDKSNSYTKLFFDNGLVDEKQKLATFYNPGEVPGIYDELQEQQPSLNRRISIANGQISQLNREVESPPILQPQQQPAQQPAQQPVLQPVLQPVQQQQPPKLSTQNPPQQSVLLWQPPAMQRYSSQGQPQEHVAMQSSASLGMWQLNEEWKRYKALERNRLSASKSRQRKKAKEEQLMTKFNHIKTENRKLRAKVVKCERLFVKLNKFVSMHCNDSQHNEELQKLKLFQDMLNIEFGIAETDPKSGIVIRLDEDQISSESITSSD